MNAENLGNGFEALLGSSRIIRNNGTSVNFRASEILETNLQNYKPEYSYWKNLAPNLQTLIHPLLSQRTLRSH